MASRCNFKGSCKDCESFQLRDRIVTGLTDTECIQNRLSAGNSLSLAQAREMCEAAESSKKQSAELGGRQVQLDAIRKKSTYKSRPSPNRAQTSDVHECKFCGRIHEMRKEKFPAFGKRCVKCQRLNHFARRCHSV